MFAVLIPNMYPQGKAHAGYQSYRLSNFIYLDILLVLFPVDIYFASHFPIPPSVRRTQ